MKKIAYQQKAVDELVEKTVELLNLTGSRKKLVFKAPTGAGKTVMASELLDRLTQELPTRGDCRVRDVAFIWVAPNKLHQQSYMKMRNYFSQRRSLQPKMYDEIDRSNLGSIKMGEILFLNWESINKERNVIVRDTENSSSIFDIVRRTKEEGRQIILVIDEEHMSAGMNAPRANNVIKRIDPKVEIRISATPVTTGQDALVNIPTEKVVEAGMIKQKILLNPAIKDQENDSSLNQTLVRTALERRNQLAEAYKKLGVNINPLLLIQLPNDNSESMNFDEQRLVDEIKQYLNVMHGINEDNNRLAVWLSNEKSNLPGIEKPNSLVDVLLFKQAIALGWDCPRAAVLLIFRKLESFQFTVQTVGRIMRMPEQHFYTEGELNVGYVYTNLSRDMIQIVADNMNYISKSITAKRRDNLQNVLLESNYVVRPREERNVIGPTFKRILAEKFEEFWFQNPQHTLAKFVPFGDEDEEDIADVVYELEFGYLGGKIQRNREQCEKIGINLNVKNLLIEIPKDIEIDQIQVGTMKFGDANRFRHIQKSNELDIVFFDFCKSLLGGFQKESTEYLVRYLTEYLGESLEMFDEDVKKLVLCPDNKARVANVVTKALDAYLEEIERKRHDSQQKNFNTYQWEVPETREYDENSHSIVRNAFHCAMQPFARLNVASLPEKKFEEFIEKNGRWIDWWYKNGDSGRQHFAIRYRPEGGTVDALFYPDYILRLKNGHVFIFDTKTPGSDIDAVAKHNALIEYLSSPENKTKGLGGGIIIEDNGIWRYCPLTIANTTDLQGWNMFDPQIA